MKRTLLVLSAFVVSLCAEAQALRLSPQGNMPQQPTASDMAVASITPTGDQLWWGYFSESDFDIFDGKIGTGSATTITTGIGIPANHEQIGNATVKAVRVYIANGLASTFSNMKIWISKTLPASVDNADYVQPVTESLKAGANDFELTTPYAIGNQAFYIGYSFKSTNGYPIRAGGKEMPNAFWISTPQIAWMDLYGQGLGKLAFQILVEGATIKSDCAVVEDFGPAVAAPGQSLEIPLAITNAGKNDITNISYTVTVNGNTSEEKTIATPAIPLNGSAKVLASIDTAPEEGTFVYTVTITKVNGNANTAENPSASGNITTIIGLNTYPRNVLIEEFTSEYCTYCPQAASGLAAFINNYPDLAKRVAVVCHHAGYYTDWLTISASSSYEWFYNGDVYAPAFMYDRYAWDGTTPPISRESGAAGYKTRVETRMADVSYANVALQANFNEDKSQIQVVADCERGWEFCSTPARLTIFLTEDNIKAHSQSGANGSFTHQHVLRAVNETWGKVIDWNDNKATCNYTFNVNSAWKTDDLKVIAFISAYDNKNPANCKVENATVVVPGTATGISAVNTAGITEAARYSLDGRQITAPQRGVNIIKMNDGSIRKVMVK